MTNTPVIFQAEKVSEGVWQIKCQCPQGKIDYVTGFLDEPSIQNWLKTEHRVPLAQGEGLCAVRLTPP